MSSEQLAKLAAIEAALKDSLELAEKATRGPWKSKRNHPPYKCVWIDKAEFYSTLELKAEDADFIAHARTMLPAAAKALLVAIEALKAILPELRCRYVGKCNSNRCPHCNAQAALISIINDWPCDRAREVTAKI